VIAEIHFKKERWEDAFNAYLHVPVFFGSQVRWCRRRIDGGALSCELERYKDAAAMFQRISETYTLRDRRHREKRVPHRQRPRK